MQRIAALLVVGAFLAGNDSRADTCETIGDIVGGFAGGAAGYGLLQNLGVASNWVSAGLYGAGIAVATTVGDDVAEEICENFEEVLEVTAAIYCTAGEYICDYIDRATRSVLRDFQLCPRCHPDQIFGAYFMDDYAREEYLRRIQGGGGYAGGVLPRDQLGRLEPSIVNAYFAGLQAGYHVQSYSRGSRLILY